MIPCKSQYNTSLEWLVKTYRSCYCTSNNKSDEADQDSQVRKLLSMGKHFVDENRGPYPVNLRNEGNGFQEIILINVSKDLCIVRLSGMNPGPTSGKPVEVAEAVGCQDCHYEQLYNGQQRP